MSVSDTLIKKRGMWAWALWDWAEQPYPTIIQTFIFPVYLASAVGAVGDKVDVQLGVAMAIAGFLLAITAPVIGRRSDESGRRKFWLVVNTYLLVAIMLASFFIEPKPEFLLFGLVLYGLGSVVQESAFINYYAMLKSVTNESNIGKVSGMAWGLGYVGGIILLCISLFGFILSGPPASEDNGMSVRVVFLFSAIWTAIFALPLVKWVPKTMARPGHERVSILTSYKQLWRQLVTLRQQAPETLKFLISSAIYRDGLAGVFTFGAVLGTLAFGFDQKEIILFGIAANLVAGVGAALGGLLDDKFGSRAVILGSLMGLVVAGTGVFALANLGPITYWVGGLLLCLFVGPAQASSRTFVSRFTPAGREGEVFGLYQTTGRAVSFLSGSLWALSIFIAHSLFGVQNATIYGVLGLVGLLAVGGWLLSRVDARPAVLDSIV